MNNRNFLLSYLERIFSENGIELPKKNAKAYATRENHYVNYSIKKDRVSRALNVHTMAKIEDFPIQKDKFPISEQDKANSEFDYFLLLTGTENTSIEFYLLSKETYFQEIENENGFICLKKSVLENFNYKSELELFDSIFE